MSQPPNRNNPPSCKDENKEDDDRLTLTGMISDILQGMAANGGMPGIPSGFNQNVSQQPRGTEFVPCFADTANQEEDDAAFEDLVAGLDANDEQEAAEAAEKDNNQKQ